MNLKLANMQSQERIRKMVSDETPFTQLLVQQSLSEPGKTAVPQMMSGAEHKNLSYISSAKVSPENAVKPPSDDKKIQSSFLQ